MKRDEDMVKTEEVKALVTHKKNFQSKNSRNFKKQTWENNKCADNSRFKPVMCSCCDKKGHIARSCPNYKEGKPGKTEDKMANKKKAGSVQTEVVYKVFCSKTKNREASLRRWLLDSGASDHMTPFVELLDGFSDEDGGGVYLVDGRKVPAKGKGQVYSNLKNEYGGTKIKLTNVLYVPNLEDNFMSLRRIEEKGMKIVI